MLTATNKMTKATSDTTKLNFITDQGSMRATVRCACRAERASAFLSLLGLSCFGLSCLGLSCFGGALATVAAAMAALVLPGSVAGGLAAAGSAGGLAVAEPFRRKA